MSEQDVSPMGGASAATLRGYLATDAQREIDRLRAELDARLAALEAALAAHDPRVSLEDLVLDLARVVTAEGVASAARGALEGQLGEQERAAVAASAASAAAAAAATHAARALEAEQQISRSLQGQLEQQRAEQDRLRQSMTQERAAAAEGARELERARAAQQELVDANNSLRKLKTQLEESIEGERRRAADLETQLTQEVAEAAGRRTAAEALEQRCVRLKSQHRAAVGAASEAMRERDELAKALVGLRQEVLAAHASVEARASSADAERAAVEQSWKEAEARRAAAERSAKEAQAARTVAERNSKEADAARAAAENNLKEAEAGRAAAERHLKEADVARAVAERGSKESDAARAAAERESKEAQAARALAERNWKDAEARAKVLSAERDELAGRLESAKKSAKTELEEARQPVVDAGAETARQLESANERIRLLELQRFERERAPRDYDVDLVPALETKPSPLSDLTGQRARRYTFPPRTKVHLGREAAVLVDVSVTGAQVICATSPEVGRIVTVTLASDEAPCFCEGRLLWAQREQSAKNRPFRYRIGLVFTALDEASLRAYIERHSIG
jgi:predicted  nucleic acid-binding Zn-ribbon protein